MAGKSQSVLHFTPNDDFYPHEWWALFITHPHKLKVTERLDHAVSNAIHRDQLLQYIKKKDSLTDVRLDRVATKHLHAYLLSLLLHRRATMIKLIHGWIPCNKFYGIKTDI
jgi:hypothetical protein